WPGQYFHIATQRGAYLSLPDREAGARYLGKLTPDRWEKESLRGSMPKIPLSADNGRPLHCSIGRIGRKSAASLIASLSIHHGQKPPSKRKAYPHQKSGWSHSPTKSRRTRRNIFANTRPVSRGVGHCACCFSAIYRCKRG